MKRCVLASGPDDTAKLTRNGFVIMCKDRRGQATAEKVRYGKFERKEDYGQCKECETGRLVEEGNLFHAPKGVEFITIGEMMEKTENTGGLPETTVLKEVPGKNLKNLTLSSLFFYRMELKGKIINSNNAPGFRGLSFFAQGYLPVRQ